MSLLDRAPWLVINEANEELLAELERLLRRPSWQADASCREHPEIDFLPGQRGSTVAPRRICMSCLVREECLAWALELGDDLVGVWGGLNARQRHEVRAGRKTVDDFPLPATRVVVSSGRTFVSSGRCAACAQMCHRTPERPENRLRRGFCPRCHQSWVRWRKINGDDRAAFIAHRSAAAA